MPSKFVRFARGAVLLLAALGILNAGYTLNLRQQLLSGTVKTSFCDVSSTVSCTSALTDPRFAFFGFPFCEVALFVYPFLIAGAIFAYRRPKAAFAALSVLGGMGVLFSAYSVYVQGWVIGIWCPLCLGCVAIVTTIFLVSVFAAKSARA